MVRLKNRYLLVHILYPEHAENNTQDPLLKPAEGLPEVVQFHRPSPDDVSAQSLARIIREQISFLYGDYGAGVTFGRLVVKYFSPATSTAIVRCSRAHYRLVWAALSFITQLPKASRNGKPRACVLQVVRVSGTIKKAEEEAIRRARTAILKAQRSPINGIGNGLEAILGAPARGMGKDGKEENGENAMEGIEDKDEEDDDDDSGG
ncbi:MAG: hypothetical protein LQ347_002354 [Umbilicaria vellea]|nr:MAG: hypothetical protein LQ347_002354 [Umbilicaria vellea]